MKIFKLPSNEIVDLVREGKVLISVVGLGWAGLPLAIYFALAGAKVLGVDKNEEKIQLIAQGVCPTKDSTLTEKFNEVIHKNNFRVTIDSEKAAIESDVHIIAVPTPIDKNLILDSSAVCDSSRTIARGLKRGDLVILQSTVYPGFTNMVVKPILEETSKLSAGDDFGLAFSLERVDPGSLTHRLDNTPRVIGGCNRVSSEAATSVYSVIGNVKALKTRNCETAEMVKLVENTYRNVNIALMNEVALLCEKLGIDVLEVLNAASTKWSFHPHVPSCGVGGACIPVTPRLLLQTAKQVGLDLSIVRTAGEINDLMPSHTVELVKQAFQETRKPVKDSIITILGITYKADVGDDRNSPGKQIGYLLAELGAKVRYYDPFISAKVQSTEQKTDLLEVIRGCDCAANYPDPSIISAKTQTTEQSIELLEAITGPDCIVVATDHSIFRNLKPEVVASLVNVPAAIVDGKHVFRPREVEECGLVYKGIGRSKGSDLSLNDVRFLRT